MGRFLKKPVVIAAIILLLGGGVAFALLRGNDSEPTNTNDPSNTSAGNESPTPSSDQPSSAAPAASQNSDNKPTSTGNAGSGDLMAPAGAFVSNHKASLTTSPSENSVCRTTPGATCEIHFTKGGTVKTLSAKQAGSDGSVSWDWKLQDLGLSAGSWQIEAVAKSGSKELSTKDTINLEVSS